MTAQQEKAPSSMLEAFKMINERNSSLNKSYAIKGGNSTFHKLNLIKTYYDIMMPLIMKHHENDKYRVYLSYPFDWERILNHVELLAWKSIRAKGNFSMYPQLPVLNYFLDFGNPVIKVGFEVDGAKWHNADKDKLRDARLKDIGWTIFRVSGTEMMRDRYRDYSEFTEREQKLEKMDERMQQDMIYWFCQTGDGVLEAINIRYFNGLVNYPSYHQDAVSQLADFTLGNHSLVKHK